jgi:hypothetical protein
VPARVDRAENDQTKNTPMAGHATIPNAENSERIFGQHGWAIKKDVPDPSTDENAEECCVEDEIADLAFLKRAVSVVGQPFHEVERADESCDVGEAVPSYPHLLIELNEERTEVVNVEGEEHCGERSTGVLAGLQEFQEFRSCRMRCVQWRSQAVIKRVIVGGQHYHHPKDEVSIKDRNSRYHSATPVLLSSAVQRRL